MSVKLVSEMWDSVTFIIKMIQKSYLHMDQNEKYGSPNRIWIEYIVE